LAIPQTETVVFDRTEKRVTQSDVRLSPAPVASVAASGPPSNSGQESKASNPDAHSFEAATQDDGSIAEPGGPAHQTQLMPNDDVQSSHDVAWAHASSGLGIAGQAAPEAPQGAHPIRHRTLR
jgi:hypothetical protein